MIIEKIKNFTRGWFIGNFDPSLHKTSLFEVGIVIHKKGEKWKAHFHKESREINVLLEGKMIIQEKEINTGDIFILEPWEISNPVFIEDCKVLVVKTASVIGDKYEIIY